MRLGLALTTLLIPLLAGCVSVERHSDNSCVNDACQDRSLECAGGDCEVCVEGECAECDRSQCKACYEDDECPMLAGRPPADNETFDDVAVQQTHDLSKAGLPRTTWTFDAAAGATGHVRIRLHDLATRERVISGGACFEYMVETWNETSWSRNEGASGDCGSGNAVQVSGTTSGDPLVLADWTVEGRGHYELAVRADVQPNELVVDMRVDNPPLQA